MSPGNCLRRGFTLVELLAVITIIVILFGLAAMSFKGVGESNNLTSAAGIVVSELDLARETALADAEEVEVRFLPMPDNSGNIDTYYRGVQIFKLSDGSAIDKIQRLPSPIVILDGSSAAYNTLFAATAGVGGNPGSGTLTLPSGLAVTYRSIDFTASGSTTLNPANYTPTSDTWFLTLKSKNAKAQTSPAEPAKDFITIQIDPVTGRTRTFQP